MPAAAAVVAAVAVLASPARAETGLAGQWHLDSVRNISDGISLVTDDSSGQGNTGSLFASSPFLTAGRFGQAFDFHAASDPRVEIAQSPSLEPQRVTVAAWVKNQGFPGALQYLVAKSAYANGPQDCRAGSYALYTGVGSRLGLQFYTYNTQFGAGYSPVAPDTIWDGQWHAVAGVYDGLTTRLYVDGRQVGDPVAAAPSISYDGAVDQRAMIGGFPYSCPTALNGRFTGALDEVRIYNRALSAAEMARLQDPGATSPPDPDVVPPGERPPTASIVPSTPRPAVGGVVALDPTRTIGAPLRSIAWDLDGSGRYAGSCPTSTPVAFKTFTSPGPHVVGLKVTSTAGLVATKRLTVDVAGRAPPGGTVIAANPALSLKRFWCGARKDIAAVEKVYLPKIFTSDVRAVGMDVTQGIVPEPKRPDVGLAILARPLAPYRDIAKKGSATPRGLARLISPKFVYLLNNDREDPRENRIRFLRRKTKTIVRVYASAIKAPNGKSVPDVQMKLYGFRRGRELPGSPLLSQTGPLTVPAGPPFTTHAMRIGYSPADGKLPVFTFTLPASWTEQGNLAMLATPTLVGARLDAQCDTIDCRLNQQTGSGELLFSEPGVVIVRSVAMKPSADPALPAPATVFQRTTSLSPVEAVPTPYQATIDIDSITKCKKASPTDKSCDDPNGAASALIAQWYNANKVTPTGLLRSMTIGVHSGYPAINGYSTWPGKCDANANGGAICETENIHPVSQVDAGRPLTSVAHEYFHDLGRPHADGPTSGCGGDGEARPDRTGRAATIGLDRLDGSGGSLTEPYRIVSPDLPGQGPQLYDLMSYCANNAGDPDSWLSAYNWDLLAGEWSAFLARGSASAATLRALARPAAGPALEISGYADATGTHVSEVSPAPGGLSARIAAAPSSSSFRAVVRGAGGGVAGSAPLFATYGHLDSGRRGQPEIPFASFHGVVPAASAQRLEILRDGGLVAAVARTTNAPRVRLLSPRRGTVGRGRSVAVRWRASDADRGALTAYVDYSASGGRRWRNVFTGANRGRATVPSRYLTGSRRARLRIRVNDGFNETAAVSGPLRALGSAPAVTIERVRTRLVAADATLSLRGHAFDDAFRPLPARRLRWVDRGRVIGRGAGLGVAGLSPGTHLIRLVARDRSGRDGSAAIRMRVLAVRPFFTTFAAPAKLGRHSRAVRLRLAVNVAATLRMGGRRYALTRRTRVVAIRVRPGAGTLIVRMKLTAGRRSATKTLRVAR